MALRDDARARLARLLARTAQWLEQGAVTEEAARAHGRLDRAAAAPRKLPGLAGRAPGVHERLLRLLGAARWPARYLLRHPGVIDELASDELLSERFCAEDFESELEHRRRSLQITGEDDDEALLNLLRRAHHAEVFRTLARDVEGRLTVEQVADDLSALADSVLRVTARWCWQRLKNRHRETPQFAIIGYGKLGGKELGYGSDLDIVFVLRGRRRAGARGLCRLRAQVDQLADHQDGRGRPVRDRHRPAAQRQLGPADHHLRGLRQLPAAARQQHRVDLGTPGHDAGALRAGLDGAAAQRFDAVREAVITAPRDVAALRAEIIAMREKVRAAHPVKAGRFDVKHSPGGMVDAEFAVQFLVLSQAASHPELIPNVGNIALLQRAEAARLLPAGVGEAAARAYRELRRRAAQGPPERGADPGAARGSGGRARRPCSRCGRRSSPEPSSLPFHR